MTVPVDPPPVQQPLPGADRPPPAPAPNARRRRWLVGAATGWALTVAVLAVVSVHRDPPTVPDQRDLADAVPAVDRAAAAVLTATAADTVVEFGPLTVTRGCRITPLRAGAEATRDVVVHVRRGAGPAALRALAAALPAGFRAQVARGAVGTRQDLRADAGDFVAVRGTADDGGDVVDLRASSGCRPVADAEPAPTVTAVPPPPGLVAALGAVGRADRLGTVGGWELRCPTGGVARTAVVDDAGPAPADLDRALDRVTGDATVVQDDPDAYAYRTDRESVVAVDLAGRLRVTDTTGC